jgi:hypothetical protein
MENGYIRKDYQFYEYQEILEILANNNAVARGQYIKTTEFRDKLQNITPPKGFNVCCDISTKQENNSNNPEISYEADTENYTVRLPKDKIKIIDVFNVKSSFKTKTRMGVPFTAKKTIVVEAYLNYEDSIYNNMRALEKLQFKLEAEWKCSPDDARRKSYAVAFNFNPNIHEDKTINIDRYNEVARLDYPYQIDRTVSEIYIKDIIIYIFEKDTGKIVATINTPKN